MAREYRRSQQYEKEIGNRLGFTADQIHDFTKRYNRKQRKLESGIKKAYREKMKKNYRHRLNDHVNSHN